MPRVTLAPEDHRIGSPDTSCLELVTYGDYQCPYTRRGILIVSRLLEQLGDALLFVYRQFPLSEIHPNAFNASLAAVAAAGQDRFWDMHVHLFRNQRRLDDEALFAYAEELGLDERQFARDFADPRTRARVTGDRAGGERLGVSSTPSFFVNGRKYDGPVEGIEALVLETAEETSAPGAH